MSKVLGFKSFTLPINGKDEKFSFNMRFSELLDEFVKGTNNGITFEVGLKMVMSKLIMEESPIALRDILLVANHAVGGKLTVKTLNDYFEEDGTDLDALSQMVITNLEETRFTSKVVAAVQKQAAAQ
ncbi:MULTISPECIES: tail assembly chaperone [Convivina]|uniref:Tail assembly chaperone n=1 Tax=Convivina intestini TaxID=1505726 RepID=A0A2U1D4D5_9LACO|nr:MULTISPECIES: tail assembly chaperone [Convivina]SDC17123.1 Phage tail assembly chaperone protein, TAC [Leuconostocaceae bacterium R-53105]PVY82544.1 tail assembly chaperone [Convivina intestini]CAH1853714.1 hypothetical protein R078131_00822 [Convivina intestini]CAH1856730.1 hypothetical protein R077815_01473 [Convivina sp. LMG 32447]CAH1857120.1 hypothetical protein R078138_01508 [Convivina sp. LMG 32447]